MISTPDLEQKSIRTAHVMSAADRAESRTDPILVFLHGFDSNMLEFRYMLEIMDKAPVEAHFVDILGWGLTERPRTSSLSYGPLSKRNHLRAFVDHIVGKSGAQKHRPVVLVGASIGGAVAIDFVLDGNRQVEGLVLIDAQAFTDKKKSLASSIRLFAELGAEVLRSKWLRKLAVELAYHSPSFKTDDVLRIGGLHCFEDGWKDATVDFIQGEGYCLKDRVQEVQVPTLVVWGEHDRVLPKRDAQAFQNNLRNSRLKYIQDSGHSPHIEKPDDVSEEILTFLRTFAD